ncbi:MAG: methyltransferase domain-containing protein [Candidatus Dadabacteria bacterium]|nr:methyltransferase domain-containing protein [Candidatus Dadabacteria bacterium]
MEVKQCCADFYENDAVKLIFGQSLHPGGLNLTKELGERLGIKENDKVLDIACGTGTSAIFLAKNFGCKVTGIDLAKNNIEEAINNSYKENVSGLVDFKFGDAENIDFENESFDFVISECSFCLFPDKQKASMEMYRVLKKNGKLGLNDVVVRGELPEKMKDILYNFICIQDAKSEDEYKNIIESAGFKNFYLEDKKDDILNLLESIRKKIFILEIAKGIKKINLEIDLNSVKENLKEIKDCVDKGIISYSLMIAEK